MVTCVLRVDCVIGNVECFASPEVMMGKDGSFLPVDLVGKRDISAFHESAHKDIKYY